jgi:hypothetical protein
MTAQELYIYTCALNGTFDKDCGYIAGGVSRILLTGDDVKFTGVDLAKRVVSLSRFHPFFAPSPPSFMELPIVDGSGVFNETSEIIDAGKRWVQSLSATYRPLDYAARFFVTKYLNRKVRALVYDLAGNARWLGERNALTLTATTEATGAGAEELNGYTLVFTGAESTPAKLVNLDSFIPTVDALATTYAYQ